MLKKQNFNDATKDAGEVGSGHEITAIYETIPVGSQSGFTSSVGPLQYQHNVPKRVGIIIGEIATIKYLFR